MSNVWGPGGKREQKLRVGTKIWQGWTMDTSVPVISHHFNLMELLHSYTSSSLLRQSPLPLKPSPKVTRVAD